MARDPTLEQSTQAKACWGIWPGLWLGKRDQDYWALPSLKSRHHGLDLTNWNKQTMLYDLYPKVWSFSNMILPSGSPKVMGLMGAHNPDALHCFSGITHCPWCGKEGQNKGTMVNHLHMVHFRLGLVCNQCHDCLSTMADTLHHHGQQECHQPGEKNPNESVLSV